MGNEQGNVLNREPLEAPCRVSWSKDNSARIYGREGHASAMMNKKVYIYGGLGLEESPRELAVLNTDTDTFNEIQINGEKPRPLCGSSLTAIGANLFLFGGLNRETGWNNDIWSFDVGAQKWLRLATTGIKPSPRDKHTAVQWGTKIVIYGGFGPATEADVSEDSEDDEESVKFTWFNDVFIFDSENNSWEAPKVTECIGMMPRAAHSATIYKNKMIVFGGKDSKSRNQNLYVLDLETMCWNNFNDAGKRPSPSSFHSAAQFGQFMIVYGGRLNDNSHHSHLNVLDCETGGWYAPVEGELPPARGQCSLAIKEDGRLVMFGGSNDFDMFQQCCKEFDTGVYYLNCGDLKSVTIPEPAPAPEAVEMVESSNQQCDMADKCVDNKAEEESSFKLAGV